MDDLDQTSGEPSEPEKSLSPETEQNDRLEAEIGKLRAELQKLYDAATTPVKALIAHGIFSKQPDINLEKEIRNFKGKKELDPIDESEIRVAELLLPLRSHLESIRKAMIKEFPTSKGLYDSKHPHMSGYLRGEPSFELYVKLVNRPNDESPRHLLKTKSPSTRDKELSKILNQVDAISTVLKKISALYEPQRKLEAEKMARERAESERKIAEEREASEKRIQVRLMSVLDQVRTTVKETLEGDDWISTFDDKKEEAIAITMIGTDRQFDRQFWTFFKPELLESPPADIIKIIMGSENVQDLFAHPELMPDVAAPIDPRTAILKRWQEDLRIHQERKAAVRIRKNFKAIESKLFGDEKIEDRRSLDSRGRQVMLDITPGKFLEKIMGFTIAEYWHEKNKGKQSGKIRILPVGNSIDYFGGIDLIAEFQSPSDPNKFSLLGIDLTIQGSANKSITKDTRTESKSIFFKEEAKKVFSPQLVKSRPEYFGRTLSVKRQVIFNEMSRGMKSGILRNLMERLSQEDFTKIPDNFMRSIYEKSREQGIREGIKTLNTEELCTALLAA